ncbi:hypothetical protein ACFX5K_01290 [Rickettsiales bacterium LUAb2]
MIGVRSIFNRKYFTIPNHKTKKHKINFNNLDIVQDYLALHECIPFKNKQELLSYLNREDAKQTIKNFIIRKLGM